MAVTDQAIRKIKDMILSGDLQPGQRLPPEKELSERLGLSRNSLREAVKALEVIKVLDVRRGDGTYVTSLEPELLLDALSFVVDLHQDHSIIEIFEVRRVLEPYAAWCAATTISNNDIARLRSMLDSVNEGTSVEDLVAHDLEFHSLINHAGGNDYMANLLDSLSSATVRARVWRGVTQEGAVARTLEEHRAIVSALESHDPEMARSWASIHVGGIEAWVRRAITDSNEKGDDYSCFSAH
ncbi:MAG: FadR family transcriptional regulator [Thermomicrobiales bacterium]|nr:FadR family transcriptional regulator [Thermomicrobiales bacterium]